MVSLTIDGKKIEVPEGTTVLRAAEIAGIEVPTLCDHAHLTPYGGCRLCVVEVAGARTLQTSCTLPVSNGMEVLTNTPKVRQARQFALTLLFSERNHFCMYCQMSDSGCELQDAAYEQDMTHWPLQPNWIPYPVDASHDDIVFDHNRCIICRRCVRACAQLVGNFTLGTKERGADSLIIADLDVPFGESSCVSCGTCVQVCPTGALIDRKSAYLGRAKDVERVQSVCVGCSVGCGVELITRDNHLLRIDGDWDAPLNEGILCQVGRFDPLKDERERVVSPMVRKNGKLKAATWEEALDTIAARLKPLAGKNGDGVAALASTRLSAEALNLFRELFAGQMQSEMVTSIEEGVTTSILGAVAEELGGPFEGDLEALKSADCVLAVGADLIENHQVAGFFVKRALPNGTSLVVVDPFENGLHEIANYSLRPKEGSDYQLVMSIMSAIVDLGLAKQEPTDLPELSKHGPEDVSKKTGVSAEIVREVAQTLAEAERPVVVCGKGVTRQNDPRLLKALVELARLVGALDDDHSALISTKGQANSLAAYLYGLDKPFEVNGHQAVYLALGDDKPSQRLIKRLEGAPFVAVQASYVSPLTAMADVVLPVEMWAEQEGYFLNLDGRLQAAHQALTPPDEVRSNADVLKAVADKLGLKLADNWKKALSSRAPVNVIRER